MIKYNLLILKTFITEILYIFSTILNDNMRDKLELCFQEKRTYADLNGIEDVYL
jgi:hypothetical protein